MKKKMHGATQLLSYICLETVISRGKRSFDQLGKLPANDHFCSKVTARFIQWVEGPGTHLYIELETSKQWRDYLGNWVPIFCLVSWTIASAPLTTRLERVVWIFLFGTAAAALERGNKSRTSEYSHAWSKDRSLNTSPVLQQKSSHPKGPSVCFWEGCGSKPKFQHNV